ncbi:succinyl-CoA synthetase beta subunit [Micromonospora pallida]|uniref:Succinyl-CoA synthetase beta subunit n=1 Tax=Micromonospora pallida TaxID=145854 RepID=A0A1C6RSC0_9ACTN|nr:ATP-grasp domain-containing protein [Micromonospora pallida]SCL20037.1 succinyl-CoA synthetase beta subunit [Micromonospora pallida]
MSKLFEHEVKELLSCVGVAVPEGMLVNPDGEQGVIDATAPGPFFVKAQVAVGDRATAGGVLRVDTLAEARAAAADILGRRIRGSLVECVLVERAVLGAWFGYAAVTIAEDPPRRMLVFSTTGGGGFDPSTAEVQLALTDGPQGYRIRRELRRIGIDSAQLPAITSYLEKLVDCALRWCAYTLETNPVTYADGRVVALDAKAELDDYSKKLLPRPELLNRPEQDARERAARDCQQTDHRGSLRYVQLVAEPDRAGPVQVASHSVGGGESMVVLDALAAANLVATNYCDTSGSPSEEKVATGAALVAGQSHIDGLFFSTCIANQPLAVTARGLVRGWEDVGWRGPTVVRFAGNQSAEARDIVQDWARRRGVPIDTVGEETDEWEAARRLAVLLTKVDAL